MNHLNGASDGLWIFVYLFINDDLANIGDFMFMFRDY